jgi:predicted phage terminase large subunit-like protein
MNLIEALRNDLDWELIQSNSDYRRTVTKHDPLLFAAIYMPHKLYDVQNQTVADISLNRFHLDVIEYAKGWTKPLDPSNKRHDAFLAPRMCGKSTWIFHILPIWAGAHKHKRYIIAFSNSDTQSKGWLMNFKSEIKTNALLAEDYPEFVDEKRLGNAARAMLDNRNQTQRANDFVFHVAGSDNAVLGANREGVRPDVILFDDIEPGESNYSAHEARKRLHTVLNDHWYLNVMAVKVFVGTTTMPDSIMDQIRKVGEFKDMWITEHGTVEGFRDALEPDYRWVLDKGINCHYYPAIVTDEDGSETSLWPEVWTMEYLNSERHTREFAMQMMNRPVSLDGGYWTEDDIEIDEPESYKNTIISVDPAVTTKRTSDFTGLAVMSRGSDGKIYVRHAEQVKYTSEDLKYRVTQLVSEYDAKVVYVETNQGGDLWKQVFTGIAARYRSMRNTEKKEVRAAQAHDFYKKGRVKHTRHFPGLEEQMLAFPRVPHDDVLDAVTAGVLYFNKHSRKVSAYSFNYQEAS